MKFAKSALKIGWPILIITLASCNSNDLHYNTWTTTGGSRNNLRYSSLSQIDTSNVSKLQVAWVYHSEKNDSTKFGPMESNPIIVNGRLYGVSSRMKLFAVDAATGAQQWQFDPADSLATPEWHRGSINMNRGVAYWKAGEDKRIIYTVGPVVFEVNAITGKLIKTFGKNGGIDLRYGLDREDPNSLSVAPTSPVIVYKDLFFVSGLVNEYTPGHIRAFDARTGQQKWIFHTIPYPGEEGYETWENKNAYKTLGSTNCWAGFSMDEKRGILYAVTGNPTNDFYGGTRLGTGLYGNCIIALDAVTGKKLWHFQTVHHDIWDRDIPTPPSLVTLKIEGKQVDALVQTTKQGFIFVLDRVTGKPLFPVKEVPVPTNTALTGEQLWPTQPTPTIPKPFVRQNITVNDLNNLLGDSVHQSLVDRFKKYKTGNLFEPPSEQGTIVFPGYDGGGEWGGPAIDVENNVLYVNGSEMAWVLTMIKKKPEPIKPESNLEAGKRIYMQTCVSCHGPNREGGGDYPSLISVEKKYNEAGFLSLISTGRRMMPGFGFLANEQKKALASFILNLKKEQGKPYKNPKDNVIAGEPGSLKNNAITSEPQELYQSTGYIKFLVNTKGNMGYPAISPPWGVLNAINLNTGEYLWKIPFGEFEELKAKGVPTTGRENYGGPVVTAGGLLFIAATGDGKFRAINKSTGKILWETDLPAPGVATPAVYSINGKEYVVIACGGSKWGGKSSDAYVAFSLPDSNTQ